jgi:hypothetical protein
MQPPWFLWSANFPVVQLPARLNSLWRGVMF